MNEKSNARRRRRLRVFAPFLILLAALAILNGYFEAQVSSLSAPAVTRAAVPAAAGTTAAVQETALPIATAIAFEEEATQVDVEASSSPAPTTAPDLVVELAGPPAGSQFAATAGITFFWQPAQPLQEGQVYVLILINDGDERRIAALTEPNLGSGYQAFLSAPANKLSAGQYEWEVRFFDERSGNLIGISERRPLAIVEMDS